MTRHRVKNILELVGNTPLVHINRMNPVAAVTGFAAVRARAAELRAREMAEQARVRAEASFREAQDAGQKAQIQDIGEPQPGR